MKKKSRKCPKAAKDMVVWKKARLPFRDAYTHRYCLVKLKIKKGTLVWLRDPKLLFRNDRKCRAESAYVMGICSVKGKLYKNKSIVAHSGWDSSFLYEAKTTVVPVERFHKGPKVCASGIHFFLKKADAIHYNL